MLYRQTRCGQRPYYALILVMAILAGLSACATVSDSETVTPPTKKQTSPALQNPSRYLLKRKVVVARFTNETVYGKSVLLGDKNLLEKQASDILITRLTEAGKFIMFERTDSQRILEALNQEHLLQLQLPADYLIIGSVTEFGRENLGKAGFMSRTRTQKAHARVSIRLVDVRSSQIIFAQEGSGEAVSETGTVMGMGSKSGYDSTLNDKAISAAIGKVVSNLVENLLEQPWRSYILASDKQQDQNYLLISGGKSQGINPGHRLVVKQRGKSVKNPQTGLITELPGKKIATIEVVELFGKTAKDEIARCRIVSGDELPAGKLTEYIIEEEAK